MALNILGTGRMTNNKVMVKKNGKMEHSIKEIIKQAKSKAKAHLSGAMIAHMKASFGKIISMEKGNMFGRTAESMKASGVTTKCMVKESSLGQTDEGTKVHTRMIRSKDSVCLFSKMVGYTRESGKMESSTAAEYTRKKR